VQHPREGVGILANVHERAAGHDPLNDARGKLRDRHVERGPHDATALGAHARHDQTVAGIHRQVRRARRSVVLGKAFAERHESRIQVGCGGKGVGE